MFWPQTAVATAWRALAVSRKTSWKGGGGRLTGLGVSQSPYGNQWIICLLPPWSSMPLMLDNDNVKTALFKENPFWKAQGSLRVYLVCFSTHIDTCWGAWSLQANNPLPKGSFYASYLSNSKTYCCRGQKYMIGHPKQPQCKKKLFPSKQGSLIP